MPRPIVTLLTDFGTRDAFAGICKGVILGIAPDAQLVDLTHDVEPFAVRDGAVLLRRAVPSLPVATHLAVVDPGVGTARRPIALRAGRGDTFVGPDNGLLVPAAEALGGIVAAHLLESPRHRLATTSATFHGRDIFSPAAAYLASGAPIEELGPAVARDDLVRLSLPEPRSMPGGLECAVLYIDGFGNVDLGAVPGDLTAALGDLGPGDRLTLELPHGRSAAAEWSSSFGAVAPGRPLVYVNSYGDLALAVNLGSAREAFSLGPDDRIAIRRA